MPFLKDSLELYKVQSYGWATLSLDDMRWFDAVIWDLVEEEIARVRDKKMKKSIKRMKH